MLPKVPMQAFSTMLPTSVNTSRDDGSRSIDSGGTSVSSSVSVAAAIGSSSSNASPATGPLNTWWTLATRSSTSLPSDSFKCVIGWIATCGTSSSTRCCVSFESDAPARPKPMFSSSTSASC